ILAFLLLPHTAFFSVFLSAAPRCPLGMGNLITIFPRAPTVSHRYVIFYSIRQFRPTRYYRSCLWSEHNSNFWQSVLFPYGCRNAAESQENGPCARASGCGAVPWKTCNGKDPTRAGPDEG